MGLGLSHANSIPTSLIVMSEVSDTLKHAESLIVAQSLLAINQCITIVIEVSLATASYHIEHTCSSILANSQLKNYTVKLTSMPSQ